MWLAETEEWTRDLFEFQQLTTNQVLCATSFSLTRFVFVGEREPEREHCVCVWGRARKEKPAREKERWTEEFVLEIPPGYVDRHDVARDIPLPPQPPPASTSTQLLPLFPVTPTMRLRNSLDYHINKFTSTLFFSHNHTQRNSFSPATLVTLATYLSTSPWATRSIAYSRPCA